MTPHLDLLQAQTRRHFLRRTGQFSLGAIALNALLGRNAIGSSAEVNPLAPRKPHFAPKAKSIIHLFMAGAPSQLDLFDHKPTLAKYEGKPIPPSVHLRLQRGEVRCANEHRPIRS